MDHNTYGLEVRRRAQDMRRDPRQYFLGNGAFHNQARPRVLFGGFGSPSYSPHIVVNPQVTARLFGSSAGSGPSGVMNAYWLLLLLNFIPFGLWQYARATNDQNLMVRLTQHTTLSLANIRDGRWWTALTSAFTHIEIWHLGFNMFSAYTMCSILSMVPHLNAIHILGVTVGSALCGSAGFLYQQVQKANKAGALQYRARPRVESAVGASGGVMGLAALATCFYPKAPMNFMFIPIAIPLWLVTIGYAVGDAYYYGNATSVVAHSAHLGGLTFGLVSFLALRRGRLPMGGGRTLFGRGGNRHR